MTATGAVRMLLGLSSLAGCSLLYNPNNLPAPRADAAPDTPTDINIEMPGLVSVGPAVLYEGQGTGGGRSALLAIVGGNIGPDATIALVPTDGGPAPLIEIDNAHAVRSPSGTAIAVPITLPVDPTRGARDTPLTIQLTQTGAMGSPVTATLEGQVVMRNLPELTAPVTSSAVLAPAYSQIKLTAAMTFAPATGAPRAILRAYGSIELRDVHADGGTGAAGPGGGDGGDSGNAGSGLSPGKPSSLVTSASGAGYGTKGEDGAGLNKALGGAAVGDDLITDYRSNAGSGGGGGGVGGGGGGTLEISAGGTLVVGAVTANGGSGSNGGGGGSGGAIILRAGGKATLSGAITAGPGGSSAGAGGSGRIRYEAPELAGSPAIGATNRRFVAFDTAAGVNPLITTDPVQTFQLVSAPSTTPFTVYVSNAANVTTDSTQIMFGSAIAVANLTSALNFGYNRICVASPTGNLTLIESTNCIEIAYIP